MTSSNVTSSLSVVQSAVKVEVVDETKDGSQSAVRKSNPVDSEVVAKNQSDSVDADVAVVDQSDCAVSDAVDQSDFADAVDQSESTTVVVDVDQSECSVVKDEGNENSIDNLGGVRNI